MRHEILFMLAFVVTNAYGILFYFFFLRNSNKIKKIYFKKQ